jgi:pimeloyl-ACP methyl ester carboxylesterase
LLTVFGTAPAACGGGTTDDAGAGTGNTATTDTNPAVTPAVPDTDTTAAAGEGTLPGQGPVMFTTDDGIALSGNLYGSGHWGVVLSHMYPADQTSWTAVAEELAQEGYLVLTYDFRGYGDSAGTKDIGHVDRDVRAATDFIRVAGATDMVLVGASMGGTASLMVAPSLQVMSSLRLAGVATLSAPVDFQGLSATDAVPQLVVPLLFIAAEGDSGAGAARQLEELSGGKGVLEILPGNDHGTQLFSGAQADTTWQLLLGFLQRTLQVGDL